MDKRKLICENEQYEDSEINVYFGNKEKEKTTDVSSDELSKEQVKEIMKMGKRLLG